MSQGDPKRRFPAKTRKAGRIFRFAQRSINSPGNTLRPPSATRKLQNANADTRAIAVHIELAYRAEKSVVMGAWPRTRATNTAITMGSNPNRATIEMITVINKREPQDLGPRSAKESEGTGRGDSRRQRSRKESSISRASIA